ncbi:MAG: hypothetical protein IKZ96_04125 [Bacilli bacterium]|nr:hypothetical protein [Bacilli bacterium]
MAKSSKKSKLLIPAIIIIVVLLAVGILFGVSKYKQSTELNLSNANNTLSNFATEAGIVDKSEGSSYITLYVTAGVIIVIGVGVFIYVHKKADE